MGLDIVEMVMDVEEAFGISLPDDEIRDAATVGQLYALVVRRLVPMDSDPDGDIWNRLLDVIERSTAVPRYRLVPSARFVLDLGLG